MSRSLPLHQLFRYCNTNSIIQIISHQNQISLTLSKTRWEGSIHIHELNSRQNEQYSFFLFHPPDFYVLMALPSSLYSGALAIRIWLFIALRRVVVDSFLTSWQQRASESLVYTLSQMKMVWQSKKSSKSVGHFLNQIGRSAYYKMGPLFVHVSFFKILWPNRRQQTIIFYT